MIDDDATTDDALEVEIAGDAAEAGIAADATAIVVAETGTVNEGDRVVRKVGTAGRGKIRRAEMVTRSRPGLRDQEVETGRGGRGLAVGIAGKEIEKTGVEGRLKLNVWRKSLGHAFTSNISFNILLTIIKI